MHLRLPPRLALIERSNFAASDGYRSVSRASMLF
jgi:hypothetical protein